MAGSVGSAVRRLYLSVYNWLSFFGWAQVLYYATLALLEGRHEAVYAAIEQPLLLVQTAALMEVLHSVAGLVRSPVSATIPQVSGRLFTTWAVLWSFPKTRSHVLVTTMVLAWSITEVIRYPFFGIRETLRFSPFWLLWLRYSTFMVLYPIGLVSEIGLVYVALPYMKASEKSCLKMLNKWNCFDYYVASALIMPFYIPGFAHLYRYMLARRKMVLSKSKAA